MSAEDVTRRSPLAPVRALAALLLAVLCQLAQAQTFTCNSNLYLSQADEGNTGVQLYRVNRTSNPFTLVPIGGFELGKNAMGYNPRDNYLYAMRSQSGTEGRRLFRINANGAVTDLGLVSGLPAPATYPFFAGAFTTANDDLLYVLEPYTDVIYRINVATRTATALRLSRTLYVADFDFANGLFYGLEGSTGRLVSIHPSTGQVTDVGTEGPRFVYGAFYADSGGLYGFRNQGGFFRLDATTGGQMRLSAAPDSGGNDGARCPSGTPALSFSADLAITKTDGSAIYRPGSDQVYTIVARNNGPFGAQAARVRDVLPTGISTASWTCSATGDAVCREESGSGGIDATVDLPVGGAVTFTLTMAVPASFTGNLANTATVAVGTSTTDPVAGNNSATDTNQRAPRVTIRKLSLGGVGGFGFTGSNGVANQTLTTTAAGTPVSGAPQLLTATGVATTITETAPPAGFALQGIACEGLPSGGTATANLATRTVTLNAAAAAASADITCTFTNIRSPILRLQKLLPGGRIAASDQFTLAIATGASTVATATTTGATNAPGQQAVLNPAAAGTAYTLSETGAGGANLAQYATSWACTNAASDGQTPGGTGASFALTPVAGDDLTCTFTNARISGSLSLAKTASAPQAVAGGVVGYTLTVANPADGPPVFNAVLRDVPGAGLDCTQAGLPAPTCTPLGGAQCPGSVTAAALLSVGGVTLPSLPTGASLAITLQCRVTATGR